VIVEPLIDLDHVSKVYGRGDTEVVAVHDVSFQVEAGEFVAIMGRSGSGKSTLMNLIGCLDVATSGRYRFAGEEISELGAWDLAQIRNLRIGFVFQQFHLLPRLSAWRNVELPLLYRRARGRHAAAVEALHRVGLGDRLDHRPSQLSGGQQQRVAIARALVADPDVLLADEPTGNLDSESSSEVLKVLSDLRQEGCTVVLITHDSEVSAVADRILQMRDGRVVEERAAG
jgi:putative ABC transport system ATP-binding protein